MSERDKELKKLDSIFLKLAQKTSKHSIIKNIFGTQKTKRISHKKPQKKFKKDELKRKIKEIKVDKNSSSNTNIKTTSSNSMSSGGGGFIFGSNTSINKNGTQNFTNKSGVVINNQSIVVKTNFEMAGRLNKQGIRPTKLSVGKHASDSLNYINNHGSKDLEQDNDLSNTYDKYGEILTQEEFQTIRNELNKGCSAFRRIVVDLGHKEIDREDLKSIIRDTMQNFKSQTHKSFDYVYAIHTDTEQIHAHILCSGSKYDINMEKEQLQSFKEELGQQTQNLLLEKSLENDLDKQIDKNLQQEQQKSNDLQI